ncbi:hypothetical protein [Shewanella algae]|uniref:hypothetical protein n=1 Tax=Shewanella algae TaxID=38313 RepID=UPI0031F4A44F
MKKNNTSPSSVQADKAGRRVSSKLLKRVKGSNIIRKKPNKLHARSLEITVIAPPHINFYKPKEFVVTNAFINDLQKAIKVAYNSNRKVVKICFRNSVYISAAAAIKLLAETERSTSKYPGVRFSLIHPPKTKVLNPQKNSQPIVDTVLNRIGFYKILGLRTRKLKESKNVSSWEHASGEVVDGAVAAALLESLKPLNFDINNLYRSSVEALANAVEHAYNPYINSDSDIEDKRWWMFVAVWDNKLSLIVCDLGHGIPNTLPKTQSQLVLDKIYAMLGPKSAGDAKLIQAATLVKKTRTHQSYRGKGGKDLTSLVDNNPGSKLTIFSNFGVYTYKGKGLISGKGYNNRSSIKGTIVEWSLPLESEGIQL